jgi:hypothetical protein
MWPPHGESDEEEGDEEEGVVRREGDQQRHDHWLRFDEASSPFPTRVGGSRSSIFYCWSAFSVQDLAVDEIRRRVLEFIAAHGFNAQIISDEKWSVEFTLQFQNDVPDDSQGIGMFRIEVIKVMTDDDDDDDDYLQRSHGAACRDATCRDATCRDATCRDARRTRRRTAPPAEPMNSDTFDVQLQQTDGDRRLKQRVLLELLTKFGRHAIRATVDDEEDEGRVHRDD